MANENYQLFYICLIVHVTRITLILVGFEEFIPYFVVIVIFFYLFIFFWGGGVVLVDRFE